MDINERFEKDGIFDLLDIISVAKALNETDYSGPRFETLLRFGLSGDSGEIPITKRAFQTFEKAQTNPQLRKRIFSATDKVFNYVLEDDLLYNRFLLLLMKDSLFKEEAMNADFEFFMAECTNTNYVASFYSTNHLETFMEEVQNFGFVDWISEDRKHLQFKVSSGNLNCVSKLIEKTNADVHLFEGDIRG
jgi:hypothetical protein